MKLFNIPDIRLFWSNDIRFLEQFKDGNIVQFKQFSKYPSTFRDISFWVTDDFAANNLYELVRSVAGDIVEKV